MDFLTHSYRWGVEHLHPTNPAWVELQGVLRDIGRQDVIDVQAAHIAKWMAGAKKNPPTGGQTALNELLEARLKALGWKTQVMVIPKENGKTGLPYWSMDFLRDQIGIEVSFNNAGVLAQNLLRMSVKAESHLLAPDQMIRLGILITASNQLKAWSAMDSTVLTFEQVKRVLGYVTFSVPTPIVVVGLNSSTDGEPWVETGMFPGKKPNKFSELPAAARRAWRDRLGKETGQTPA